MHEKIKRYFEVERYGSSLSTEIFAGLTTFAAMAYIIAMNPIMLEEAGLNFNAVLITTIIISALASIGMGLFARIPMASAPGMGVSAFFAYSVVVKGGMSWQLGLTACFFAAILLLILNVLKIRQKILVTIPITLLKAITGGIGLFLITVAMHQIGLIDTPRHHLINFKPTMSHQLILTIIGVILIKLLWYRHIKSAYIIVILLNSVLALTLGITEWHGFFALPPTIAPSLFKLSFDGIFTIAFYKAFFSIFLVTLFDSSAGLITLGRIIYPSGQIPRVQKALTPDSTGSILGSLMGTTPLAIHIESAAGIQVGGRTGITSITVGLLFIACLFLSPIARSIPQFASAPVLISLGIMMLKELKSIPWRDITESIPVIITVISMPLFFSIYYGFAFGFISYVGLKWGGGRGRTIPTVCWVMALLFIAQLILI